MNKFIIILIFLIIFNQYSYGDNIQETEFDSDLLNNIYDGYTIDIQNKTKKPLKVYCKNSIKNPEETIQNNLTKTQKIKKIAPFCLGLSFIIGLPFLIDDFIIFKNSINEISNFLTNGITIKPNQFTTIKIAVPDGEKPEIVKE